MFHDFEVVIVVPLNLKLDLKAKRDSSSTYLVKIPVSIFYIFHIVSC